MAFHLSVFIFRRDLRLDDNTGLIKAMIQSNHVIPLFILSKNQVSQKNKYKSSNAIQFMMESLEDLNNQIKSVKPSSQLVIMYGDEISILKKLKTMFHYDAIFVNDDYTPYAVKRDNRIKAFCKSKKIRFISSTDVLLLDTLNITTGSGTRYKIFTQFYNKTKTIKIRKPVRFDYDNFKTISLSQYSFRTMNGFLLSQKFYGINNRLAIRGGRTNGLNILKGINRFANYTKTRDIMSKKTTMLSAHNKFGTLSIREVYHSTKRIKDLNKQLYWRDFYYYVSVHFKSFYQYRHLNHPSKKVKWIYNKAYFNAWKNGRTGFPIVDAAMTELNTTGFMHNRGRMIVASFLVKDLLIDWRHGERYFSRMLVDIDRAQNTGNWNWSSSMGLDATSFLRIFNPWTQSKEYDPDASYIKKWLPQLKHIPADVIHGYRMHEKFSIDYPKPIVDHSVQRKKFIKLYKTYFK